MHETGEPKRVALFGGSFNPPHVAHQFILLYLLETAPVDEVWLMPCHRHAFSKDLAPYEFRRAWCEALAEPFGKAVRITDIERELGGESRTIDTLAALTGRHPDHSFRVVLGSDIRAEREKWKQFDEIERRYGVLWIGREGHDPEPGEILLPDISSRQVRSLLARGLKADHLVPRRVLRRIIQSGWTFAGS